MQKLKDLKALFGKKDWDPPVIDSDEIKNETQGEMIYTGREMVNAMGFKDKEYLSEKGRFFPKEAYYKASGLDFLKSKKGDVQIKPGTVKYYEALSKGTLGRIRRKPKLPPISAANRVKEADRIKSLRDQNYTLDLAEYQSLLANPKTSETAKEELLIIKALIEDAAKMDVAALEKKMATTKLASSAIGLVGTVLGAASGLASVGAIAEKAANAAQGAAGQAYKITEAVVDRVGQAQSAMAAAGVLAGAVGVKTQHNLNVDKLKKLNRNSASEELKTASAVAMKTAGLVLLGVAANLTAPGATITALAIVTTAVKGGLNIYAQRLEKKNMALQMNKTDLLSSIDEMIKNNGTIFYKEDNPMFKNGLALKEKVDEILNTQENYKVIDEVAQLENGVRAAALLDDMMANAANTKYNAQFEQNLLKSKEIEKLNNATVQKLRDRRGKLKRLYTTYKKPSANTNIIALAQNISETPLPQEGGKRRKTRKHRRS
jgi:hypothetical protein